MNSTDKQRKVFFPTIGVLVMLVVVLSWSLFNAIESPYGAIPTLVYAVIYFFVGLFTGKNLKSFFTVVGCVVLTLSIGSALFLGSFISYLLFFLMAIIFNHVLGAGIALIMLKLFWSYRADGEKLSVKQFVIIGLVLGILGVSYNNYSIGEKAHEEALRRNYFAGRISAAVAEDVMKQVDLQSIIALGFADPLYESDHLSIFHGYGGEISVDQKGDDLVLTYHDIPPGKPCAMMYYFQPIGHLGFRETTINGEPKPANTNGTTYSINYCSQVNHPVKISYSGNLEEMKKGGKWIVENTARRERTIAELYE